MPVLGRAAVLEILSWDLHTASWVSLCRSWLSQTQDLPLSCKEGLCQQDPA